MNINGRWGRARRSCGGPLSGEGPTYTLAPGAGGESASDKNGHIVEENGGRGRRFVGPPSPSPRLRFAECSKTGPPTANGLEREREERGGNGRE